MKILGYHSKRSLLASLARDRNVLHLGAVGETCGDTERRVAAAPNSVHSYLTHLARSCVGVDNDEAAVAALLERRVFDNLICADVTRLTRDTVPLDPIELIVAGDVLEHLSAPGTMLDAARTLSSRDTNLVVTVPNALGLPIFLRYSVGKVVEGQDHVCSFNIFSLANLLRRHGWEPRAAYSCYQDLAAKSSLFAAGRAVFRRIPRWGGTLMVVAKPTQEA